MRIREHGSGGACASVPTAGQDSVEGRQGVTVWEGGSGRYNASPRQQRRGHPEWGAGVCIPCYTILICKIHTKKKGKDAPLKSLFCIIKGDMPFFGDILPVKIERKTCSTGDTLEVASSLTSFKAAAAKKRPPKSAYADVAVTSCNDTVKYPMTGL